MKNASVHKAFFAHIVGCVFFILIFMPVALKAQSRGTVKVYKDALIDTLIAKRYVLTTVKGSSTSGFSSSGYRIQIYSGSNRREAYNIQDRFQNEYPGVRTYITYRSPNFKVHAGDFRTRMEAEKMARDLRDGYSSVFIMAERINPPKADTND